MVLSGSIVETIFLLGNCPLAGRLSIIGDSKAAGNSMAGRAAARTYIGSRPARSRHVRVALDFGDLVETALMAAVWIGSGEERLHDFDGGFSGDDAATEGQNVGVIVFAGEPRGRYIVSKGRREYQALCWRRWKRLCRSRTRRSRDRLVLKRRVHQRPCHSRDSPPILRRWFRGRRRRTRWLPDIFEWLL